MATLQITGLPILTAVTALTGFTGHAVHCDYNPSLALPLAVITIISSIIGGKFALKVKPEDLKKLLHIPTGLQLK